MSRYRLFFYKQGASRQIVGPEEQRERRYPRGSPGNQGQGPTRTRPFEQPGPVTPVTTASPTTGSSLSFYFSPLFSLFP